MARGNSSCVVFCALLALGLVSGSQAGVLEFVPSSVLRFFSQSAPEAAAESCGPQLSIETPQCTVEGEGNGYELRRYPAGQIWVETVLPNTSYDTSCSVGFYRCFYFISGRNSRNENIEMTGPVLIKPVPKKSGWKISFFAPSRYESVEDLPEPNDPTVKISQYKERLVAVVGPFGGRPGVDGYDEKWKKLKSELDHDKLKYDESSVVYAGYSSPFEIFDRKQEVHVTIVEE